MSKRYFRTRVEHAMTLRCAHLLVAFFATTLAQVASVGASPPSAYDLQADLAQREEVARASLGAKVRLARVEGVFLVVGDRSMSKRGFKSALALIRKTVAAYLNNRFDTLPKRAVAIYLFAQKRPYQAYCKKYYGGCGTPYGVYYHGDRRIVMNIGPGSGTLTHELVHPIVAADFPRAPEWINEGIASLFERPRFPAPGQIRGIKNWRYPRLARALRSRNERDLASLERLIGMSDEEFRGAGEDLHYSMARYVCQWLDEQKLLWPFYRTWRDSYEDDPTGVKTFIAVVGKTPGEAHAAWARWVKEL